MCFKPKQILRVVEMAFGNKKHKWKLANADKSDYVETMKARLMQLCILYNKIRKRTPQPKWFTNAFFQSGGDESEEDAEEEKAAPANDQENGESSVPQFC